MIPNLLSLFDRDLQTLAKEINAYTKEENMWLKDGQVNNTAANLCMHLFGNLQHFIGVVLGKTGYVRDRDFEFNGTGVNREKLLEGIETTRNVLKEVLPKLSPEELDTLYPINVLGYEMTTRYFLLHLYGHFNYHLGQITYHRRLLDK